VEKYNILPISSRKNQLHEALANKFFEDANEMIALQSEAQLVECFEEKDGCLKSSLHLIADISDSEEATNLCSHLMQKISNVLNRECLLNARTDMKVERKTETLYARAAAIHIAAYNGNAAVVRLLCQKYGIDASCNTSETIEEEPRKGVTPLMWAARNGHVEVVKVLLDNHADVKARDTFHAAVKKRHTGIVKSLVGVVQGLLGNRADVNAGHITALHYAAGNGHTETVMLLLDHNADVNDRRFTDGFTALQWASQQGHTETVKLLLDRHADINAKTTDQNVTALHGASQEGHTETVKLLLDRHADINVKTTDQGVTALHCTSLKGHTETVKLLLDRHADMNTRTNYGKTALHCASQEGHTETVKLLLDRHADINVKTTHEETTALHYAVYKGHTEVVKLLLDYHADVNAESINGNTALHFATYKGNSEVLKLLIENKADVNACGSCYETALYVAADEGHTEVVKLLLQNEADVNARSYYLRHFGEKPIDVARRKHHTDIVKLLQQAADTDCTVTQLS